MQDHLPLRAVRPVSSLFAVPLVQPEGFPVGPSTEPLVYIAPLASRADQRVLLASLHAAGLPAPRWIATRRHRVRGDRLCEAFLAGEPVLVPLAAPRRGPDRLARLLSWARQAQSPAQLIPISTLWGPLDGPPSTWRALLDNPYDPMKWSRWLRLLRRRNLRVILGRPGSLSDLVQAAPRPDDALALSAFVRGQAVKALSVSERQVLGDRYKVPRFVVEQILQEPEFRDRAAAEGSVAGWTRSESLQRAERCLRELATGHNFLYMEIFRRFVQWLYRRVYDPEIDVDPDQLERLHELGKTSALVFAPSHKSNFDHLILYYLLFTSNFPPPHTAAGNNMSFFPMNLILPGTGAYFIRRSFQDDPVYKECLRAFITYLVERRFHQEFFIEGGRTRSGKLLPPRYGMLRYVVDAVRRSNVYDVFFVPTAITYDQILEVDDYARQEQGEPKEEESFGFLVRTVRSLRSRRFGRVYVRFAEPIALRDYLRQRGDDELAVEKLAFRISNEINAHTRLTAVSAVCSALLSAGRCALTVEELSTQLGRMLDFAAERGIPIGRELQAGPKSAMDAGIRALTDAGLVKQYEAGIDPIYWVPEDQRHVASYYRNAVVHFFLVRAITALAERAAAASADTEAEASVETWALRLRELLKFEFFFRDRAEFSDEVSREQASLVQEKQAGLRPIGAAGPQVMLDYLESYWVVTESLSAIAHTHNDISESEFLVRCHAIGRQLLLQDRIHAPEPLSNSNFRNALRLATNLGAAEITKTGYRRGNPAALNELARDLELLAQLARG